MVARKKKSGRQLTESDREKLTHYFVEKGVTTKCPSCGTSQWSIAPDFVELPVYTGIMGVEPEEVYPVVLLFCVNCAFCRIHAALQIGLKPRKGATDGD